MPYTFSRYGQTRRDFLIRTAGAGLASAVLPTSALAQLLSGSSASRGGAGCPLCGALSGATMSGGESAVRPTRTLLAATRTQVAAMQAEPSRTAVTLRPDWVLGVEHEKLKLLKDHDVVIEEDRIAEVRPRGAGRGRVIELREHILLPGFISGHTHSCAGTLTRGFIEETTYAAIQGEGHAPRARSLLLPMTLIDELSEEELDDLTAVNLAEMVRTGCTTQVEMSLSLKQMQSYVRVATRFGIRGYPGGMVPGISRLLPIWARTDPQTLHASEEGTLKEIAAVLAYSKGVNGSADGRIRPMMAPSVVSVQTRKTFAAVRQGARELGNGVHIHIQNEWRARDRKTLREDWGKREVEILREVGLLDDRLFGGHLLGTDVEKDLPVLARAAQFTFAHCPSGAGAGVLPSSQPYPEALAAGVNTSIGLDTHSNDYLENVKLAMMQGRSRAQLLASTSRVALIEPTIWHALESATLGGARGLGRTDLGRIQAGAKADLCTVFIGGLLVGSGAPAIEPLNNLLYTNGLSVRNVMTDGRWQVRDGTLLVGQESQLVQRGGAAVEKIWTKLRKAGYFDAPAG